MAPFSKTVFTSGVTPASAAELNNFGDGIVEAQRQGFLTALPSPTTGGPGGGALADGQECYYVPDSTNFPGVVWHLKYRSADSKWWFIGGSPLYVEAPSLGVDYTSATYGTYTGIISVTAPLAGDYRIEHGHGSWHTANGGQVYMAPSLGGVAPVDSTDAAFLNLANATGAGSTEQMSVARQVKKTGVAAATVIDYRARTNAVTAKLRMPWMAVYPIRVS